MTNNLIYQDDVFLRVPFDVVNRIVDIKMWNINTSESLLGSTSSENWCCYQKLPQKKGTGCVIYTMEED